MDRSNFYYDQEVTEAEMDQAFDDVERMEQDITVDLGLWGVWSGLAVQQQVVPNLTVKVTLGVARDELGRRIEKPTDSNVDLTSYLPSTPGNEKRVHIYVENADTQSDPRIDGFGTPLYYRKSESFTLSIVAGAEYTPPNPPDIPATVANKVRLCEITLSQGMTQILTANINSDFYPDFKRQVGGIGVRHGKINTGPIWFDASENAWVYGLRRITLSSGATSDLGFVATNRQVTQVGKLSMTPVGTSGLGIDMNGTDLDCDSGDIRKVDALKFNNTATGLTTEDGSSQIDILNDTDWNDTDLWNILNIRDIDQIIFRSGSGSGLDMVARDIVGAGTVTIDVGSATGMGVNLNGSYLAEAQALFADGPSTASKGFRYGDMPGTYDEVNKYFTFDACHFSPLGGSDQDCPYLAGGSPIDNSWYLESLGPLPIDDYDEEWKIQLFQSAAMAYYPPGLAIPIVGLPYGSKFTEFKVYCKASSMPTNARLGVCVYRRTEDGTTCINDGGVPSPLGIHYSDGDAIVTVAIEDSPDYQTVSSAYSYYAVVFVYCANTIDPAEDSGISVHWARAQCVIREASGVY